MLFITQHIFIKEGKKETFLEFENFAIPLMEKYGGEMIYRIRPDKNAFITATEEIPFEIHFLSFNSEDELNAFMNDETRLQFIHLKEESIRSSFLVKGNRM